MSTLQTNTKNLGAAKRQVAGKVEETAPVKIWATIGALILAFELYVIYQWITGPYFTPVDAGPTPIPEWMLYSIRIQEVAFVLLWMWCLWHFLIRPRIKEGRWTTEGLMCASFFVFVVFQDPMANWGGPIFTYNAYLWNMGSWLQEIPGTLAHGAPGAQLPEPLWTAALYPSVVFLFTMLACWMMRQVRQRFPNLTTLGLLGLCLIVMSFVDLVLEGYIFMPLGGYTYAGAPNWASINVDHYYKFPLIGAVAFGAAWTGWASLLYFKDDRGLSIAERGIENLAIPAAQKSFLRFLAIGGFTAVIMFVCVIVPWYWMAQHMSAYPEDVQKRSYFLNGICGEGTTQSCFGPAIPLTLGNTSVRVGPNGELFLPEGTVIPKMVPLDRGSVDAKTGQ